MREARVEGSSKAPWIILVIFGIVMAFLGYEMMEFKRAGKKIYGVEVRISPAQLMLKPGEARSLEASILGSENFDIGWSIQEANAGGKLVPGSTVSHDGHVFSTVTYTAPANAGVYHVVASSRADETRTSVATVTVTP